MNLAKYIDYTLLKATATPAQIEKLCQEARQYGFFSVCVNSGYVPLVVRELKGSEVKVCTVVGFPLGAMSTQGKLHEASTALAEGADEVDMVINLGLLLSGQTAKVRDEIALLKKETADKVLKVIRDLGLDGDLLRALLARKYTSENLDLGRLNDLKETVDREKAKVYFNEKRIIFLNIRIDEFLRELITR